MLVPVTPIPPLISLIPLELLVLPWEGLPVFLPASQTGRWPTVERVEWTYDFEVPGVPPELKFDVGVVTEAWRDEEGEPRARCLASDACMWVPGACFLWVPAPAAIRVDPLGAAAGFVRREPFLASDLRRGMELALSSLDGEAADLDDANFRKRVDVWVRNGRLVEVGELPTSTRPGRAYRLVRSASA